MPDHLWSPWRSTYVSDASQRSADGSEQSRTEPSGDDTARTNRSGSALSLFARLEREHRDQDNLILWRGEHVFVIMNLYPYNNGHLLVVPYRTVRTYTELTREERHALADALDRCMHWLDEALSPDGMNVGINIGGAAGAGIPDHLHAHIVPRWQGDTNFMATTNDTRVLPEDLTTTYQKIRSVMTPDEAQTSRSASDCNDS